MIPLQSIPAGRIPAPFPDVQLFTRSIPRLSGPSVRQCECSLCGHHRGFNPHSLHRSKLSPCSLLQRTAEIWVRTLSLLSSQARLPRRSVLLSPETSAMQAHCGKVSSEPIFGWGTITNPLQLGEFSLFLTLNQPNQNHTMRLSE